MDSVIFEGLSAEEKEEVLGRFKKMSVEKGHHIKKEGEPLTRAFFLFEGQVSIRKRSSEEEMEIAKAKAGDDIFFSLTCLVGGGESLTTVVAEEATVILEIAQEDFFAFCSEQPQIGVKLLQNIVKALAGFLKKSDEKMAEMYKTLEEVL